MVYYGSLPTCDNRSPSPHAGLERASTPSRIGGIAARTDEGKSTLSACSEERPAPSRIGGIAARTDEGKSSLSAVVSCTGRIISAYVGERGWR